MASVTITGLTKSYSAEGGAALSSLDLAIGDNQFVTLLGPSGCGKTTTLRLIAGYMNPDTGTIQVDGRVVSSKDMVVPPESRGMGMVFQNYAVWPHKTVFENVAFGLKVRKIATSKIREKVAHALELVNLGGLENRLPSELSGGQQQRVALARSLVVEPDILLLDEPLSNLDAKLRERMRIELKQLQRRTGITFIYVTHDQSEALALSDQVAVMHGGKLQQFGPPHEIYTRPANRMVADFMGHINFLPARITGTSNGRCQVMVLDRLALEAELPAGVSTGSAVDVAVRPENVVLSPEGSSAAGLVGKVNERTFLGNLIEYEIALQAGPNLRVQTHPGSTIAAGQNVVVGFEPDAISVFAASKSEAVAA